MQDFVTRIKGGRMMFKRIKKHMKNEKGLTLIELLAVVVILGIIAAIAVPSIGGLINNSKKDAHIANAQMMVSAARMAITDGSEATTFTLKDLVDGEYLEPVTNPSNKGSYNEENSKVTVSEGKYNVILAGDGFTFNGGKAKDPESLTRKDISIP